MSKPTDQVASTNGPGLTVLFSLSALVAITDRVTKVISDNALTEGMPVPVFPGFDLLLGYNAGAAFSFLSEAGGWQRLFLTGVSLVLSIILAVWITRTPQSQKQLRIGLALILGGALGNLYDRMLAGYVIDFISLYFGQYRFATFNIADAAISIGAGLLLLDMFMEFRRSSATAKSG